MSDAAVDSAWADVCAACAEGTPPERCAYYGDPDGCNAPTLGKHPEGDLAERLQEALEKAERRIAELERAFGNAAAMREALERIVNLAPEYPARGADWNALAAEAFLTASSALAAPARNCDKFATADDARDAAKKEFSNTMLLDDRQLRAVCDWLFAPAEGGDHA